MDLFMQTGGNLLGRDGDVVYHGPVLTEAEANRCLQQLLCEIAWQHDEVVMFGRRIITRRMTAWYADTPLEYTYSCITRRARIWSPLLLMLKGRVEAEVGAGFNACLLNLYHDGSEGMSWHSDDEAELVDGAAIASLSLGAERPFMLRHRSGGERVSIMLEHGSLLVMRGETQTCWQHALPVRKRVTGPRVNLTFRLMKTGGQPQG